MSTELNLEEIEARERDKETIQVLGLKLAMAEKEVERLREENRIAEKMVEVLQISRAKLGDRIRSLRDWQKRARLVCLDVVNNWCDERAKSDARALLSELEGGK